ncbi:DNA polymerase III delta prime subunit [Melghirimyces profundicolus]|uniref:DNA polymerase III delta prime subunit n=1 Tax=Melghirimyces profundicolus TaxID=1242148 RepID=A0A2T6BGM1_9BACL|nr:DNA polymerase III subunit delta' [Melghirimyces profundicolus]PTX55213.1 DNA polymerase III delta prime subunit [Melghirimyces profundicolus]
MSFDKVTGQERVVRLLKNALRNQRVAHAYCFAGRKGTGKEKTALEFAKALNCLHSSDEPCDRCRSCRRIDHGNHPDVTLVEPDGQTIKIGQMRELQRKFSYSPSEESMPVVILRQAEAFTLPAANSLLKFLEEPTARIVAILLTENLHALLPTILSRCQLIRFHPLSPHRIEEILTEQGVPPDRARILSHLASGVTRARELADQDGFAPFCERVIKWNEEIASGKSDALVEIQTWLSTDPGLEEMELLLDLSLLWLRDLLKHRAGNHEEPVFSGWSEDLRRQASKWTLPALLNAMDAVIHARKALTGPVQSQAVLERMVLSMQGGLDHAVSRRSPFQASG